MFWGQIFELEILMDLHVLKAPESEDRIFEVWSVCMCVCIYIYIYVCVSVCLIVCYQNNSKTNYSINIKFGMLYLYHVQMLLKTFYKDWRKTLCTGTHKRIVIHYGLWMEFLLSEFSYIEFRVNVMKFTCMFAIVKNM